MKNNLIKSRTCVYNINYHVVWSVKYRNKVLTHEIETFMQSLAQEIALEKGFIVNLFEVGERTTYTALFQHTPKYLYLTWLRCLKVLLQESCL